jgi:hypothetical protein
VNWVLCMARSVLTEFENEPENEPETVFCMFRGGIGITDNCVFPIIRQPI